MKKSIIIAILAAVFLINNPSAQAVYETNTAQSSINYVPNQLIVQFKSGQSPQELKTQSSDFSTSGIDRAGALQDYSAIKQYNQSLGITNTDSPTIISKDSVVYATNGTKSVEEIVAEYNSRNDVDYAQPNYLYHVLATPNDQLYGQMWALPKINAPTAWDKTKGLKSVIVADIDSGIDRTHPDLASNVVEEKSFAPCAPSGDTAGHGTHTAGTIGAVGNNSAGIVGVNWEVGIMGLKVGCTGKDMSTSYITSAISYAVSHGAKVINMSLGGSSRDPRMAAAISSAVSAGVTVVVAAGNDGGQTADRNYPAADPNVITVGATGPSDEISHYSSQGLCVDISAPGGNAPGGSSNCTAAKCITSTWPGGRYIAIQGTSMATPHVTGLVALMYALKPSIRPSEVKSILETTAVDLGTPGRDNAFGAGRINAQAALNAVAGGGGGGTQPTTAPAPTTQTPRMTPRPITQAPRTTPQPTPGNGRTPCASGDYDCSGSVDKNDYIAWVADYKAGKTTLGKFEEWRKAMFRARS